MFFALILAGNLAGASAFAEKTYAAEPNTKAIAAAQAAVHANLQKQSAPAGAILRGGVSHSVSPFKEDGSTETIKQGTALNLTVTANLNSELNEAGDEFWAEVTSDVSDSGKVLLPGKWKVRGRVSRVEKVKRMGRDGYIEIKFDKLVSPDGKWEIPLDAEASTKESTARTVTKQVATTSGYATVGAVGGSILSVQLTGIPLAVSTYGLSVAVGAAAGATLGVAAALRRKGDILCALPGDEITIRLPESITLPAFNQDVLPSKAPKPFLDNVNILVKDFKFRPYPFGDKKSRLLTVKFMVENHSKRAYSFSNIALKCSHNHNYVPDCLSEDFKQAHKSVGPNAVQEATLTFQVGNPRLKYWLVLLDQDHSNILSQVAIN